MFSREESAAGFVITVFKQEAMFHAETAARPAGAVVE